jgi:hypothetical protein
MTFMGAQDRGMNDPLTVCGAGTTWTNGPEAGYLPPATAKGEMQTQIQQLKKFTRRTTAK